MTIEQLPSGSYRITQKYNNKRYRVTVDHKPDKKEALQLLAEVMDGCEVKGSFRAAALDYIKSRENILSPRTVREYYFYPDNLPKWFVDMPLFKIDANQVQKCVNELAADKSAKTIRNYHAFISAVLGMSKPNLKLKTTLPKLQKSEPYIPRREDLAAILKECEGSMFEVPILLACYGLRRGEICALNLEDLTDDNVIHVTKDMVANKEGEWVIKPPKTPTSVRNVPIDDYLADKIRAQGYIYKGHPGSISKHLARVQKKLGLEAFSLHKLRHLFASLLLDKGYNPKLVQELGGWASPDVINRRYWHQIRKGDKINKKIAADISKYYC